MKKLLQAIGRIFNLVVLSKDDYEKLVGNPPTVDGDPIKPTTLLTYHEIVAMLSEYDNTRFEILINGLGFEDTRVNTFDFAEVKNYLAYAEALAKKKGITLKGISFVKGAYTQETAKEDDFIGYENLLYLPTAIVDGKEIQIDLGTSSNGNIVSFKDMLANHGYEWRYDNVANYKKSAKTKSTKEKKQITNAKTMQLKAAATESVVGNYGHLKPPRA